MKCSKQLRNSSPIATRIFWINCSFCSRKKIGKILKGETVMNLSVCTCFHISLSLDLPWFLLQPVLEKNGIIMLCWQRGWADLHCLYLRFSIPKYTPSPTSAMFYILPYATETMFPFVSLCAKQNHFRFHQNKCVLDLCLSLMPLPPSMYLIAQGTSEKRGDKVFWFTQEKAGWKSNSDSKLSWVHGQPVWKYQALLS